MAGQRDTKWWVLASVACGTFMATLDSSIVNIALPTLTKQFSTELFQIKWVVIIYLWAITCLLLPFGRLSDQAGRKFTFQLGFLIFVLGSFLCSVSDTLGTLVFCRAIQAIGASLLMVNGPAIITAGFPATERGAALGTLAMVVSTGLISGPTLGGFLITHLGWRSIFWINIPVGFLGIGMVYRFVGRDAGRQRAPFDWLGALLQVILLTSFIMLFDPPLIAVSGSAPMAIPRWAILAVLVGFLALFIKIESDARAPVFDVSILRDRTFSTANLAGFLTFVAYSSVTVLMPFFLEEALGYPPHKAGLFLSAIPLMIFIIAPMSGRLSDRLGSQELSVAGALFAALALFGMSGTVVGSGLTSSTAPGWVVGALATLGFALGLFQSPNNNAIMGAIPHAKLGAASAFLATVRNLGMVVGTGLSTGLFSWQRERSGDFISALHLAFFVAGMVAIGSMIACLGKERVRRNS